MEVSPLHWERRVSATGPQRRFQALVPHPVSPVGTHCRFVPQHHNPDDTMDVVSVQDVSRIAGSALWPIDGHLVLNPEWWDTSLHDALRHWILSARLVLSLTPLQQGMGCSFRMLMQVGFQAPYSATPTSAPGGAVTTRQAQGSDSPGGLYSALGPGECVSPAGRKVQAPSMASSDTAR